MAIIDDYAAIAAELRRKQAETAAGQEYRRTRRASAAPYADHGFRRASVPAACCAGA